MTWFHLNCVNLKVIYHLAVIDLSLPPANEVWGKVIFSKVFVCPWGFSAHITGHMTRGWGSNPGEGVCIQRGGGLPTGSGVEQTAPPRFRKAGGTHPTGIASLLTYLFIDVSVHTINAL